MIRFLVVLTGSAACVAGLTITADRLQWIDELPSFFYQIILFLLFATFVIFRYLYRIDKPDLFVRFYLLSMALKLVAYGAFNLIVILEDRQNAPANVVFFMALYFVFTALEIAFLYHKISRSERP